MVKGAPGNLQKEKIINKRKHAGRRPIGIKYFEARMVYRLPLNGETIMNFLEERIVKDGIVKEGNVLKVDSFLNHQMDIDLFDKMGEEFKRRFADCPINKILTIEASGIGIAI